MKTSSDEEIAMTGTQDSPSKMPDQRCGGLPSYMIDTILFEQTSSVYVSCLAARTIIKLF